MFDTFSAFVVVESRSDSLKSEKSDLGSMTTNVPTLCMHETFDWGQTWSIFY